MAARSRTDATCTENRFDLRRGAASARESSTVAGGASADSAAGAGAAAVLATAPVTGPLGAALGGLVGGHLGGLVGSLAATDDEPLPRRLAGMMVAVAVEDEQQRHDVIRLLRGLDAGDLERAEGSIREGDWVDFDPLSIPLAVDEGA